MLLERLKWKLLIILCIYGSPLMSDWSAPEIIYSPSGINNVNNSFLATDGNGNCVAVWVDTTGCGTVYAANLASESVNASGQPNWVLTNPIVVGNPYSLILNPYDLYGQIVGMDSNGTATAVWSDNYNIYTSTLPLGETTWSSPITINTQDETISDLYIAVAANGNAIVTWNSGPNPYSGTAYANVYDAENDIWRGQTALLDGSILTALGINQAAIDPQGNCLVVVGENEAEVQAISYNFDNDTWTQIPSIAATIIVLQNCALDSQGNGTIVWTEENNSIHAATLLFNQPSFSNPVTLSTNVNPFCTSPIVAANEAGSALAVWADGSGALASARYSLNTGAWTTLPLLDLGGLMPFFISLSGDATGNVAAAWTMYPTYSSSTVVSSTLAAEDSSWQQLSQLTQNSRIVYIPKIIVTAMEDAVAMWQVNNVTSSIFLGVFPPAPPSSFTGKIMLDQFLTQTDRIHQLNWGASPNTEVVSYNLYRNSVLLANISAASSPYSFMDHGRSTTSSDTYMLTAVNANGLESAPLYVTLQ